MNWRAEAKCKGMDTSMFFPGQGAEHVEPKQVCKGCPVIDECLAEALRVPRTPGIWGGTSEKERAKMRGARRRNAA